LLLAGRPHPRARPPFPTRRSSDLRSGRALPFPAVMGPVPRGRALVDEGKELVEERGGEGPQVLHPDDAGAVHKVRGGKRPDQVLDRKSTRLNSSHVKISYAVFCLK